MYRVEVDGHTIHDPRDEHFILPYAKLDLELNKTGSFEFDITTENPGYEYVSPMKSVISVYDDGKLIFRGRSTTEEKDFYNTGTLKCEGELSYFVDTILRPRSSAFIRQTNWYIFSEVVKEHNNQVGADKQFQPGIVDVDQEEISSISFNYEKPLDFINKNLIEKYNGYLRIRYADGKRYLDWVKQYGDLSGQEIRFGYNLLDLKKTLVSTDVCTVVVPVGGSDKKVTVKNAVVGGKTYGKDYIQSDEAVNYFGKIIKMQEFPDKKSPNELYAEGEKWLLENMKSSLTVELTALDLHMVDVNIDDFKLGDLVKVVSVPHSIVFKDDLPVIEKYSYDITDPSKNTITVGKTLKVFTERKDPVIYDKVQEVTGSFEGYVETTDGKIEEITNEIQEFKTLVIQDFTAVNGSIEQLTSKQANFETATAENFISTNAEISNLSGDFLSFQSGEFDSLKAKQATFENLTAENFTAVRAEIDNILIGNLDADYAKIDFANIDTAKVKQGFMENLMVSQRIFTSDITAAEGTFTNYLTGVNILANNITAGTLSVERLIITGSDQSVVYEINKANGTPQLSQTTVDGGSLTERTITADRIVAGSITGNEIAATTITGQHIVANSITATNLNVNSIFAQDITATGTITGINLVGATGSFSGNITAATGTIGPWNIGNSSIWKGNSSFANVSGMYFGNDGLSITDKFKVTSGGTMTATNVNLSGVFKSNGSGTNSDYSVSISNGTINLSDGTYSSIINGRYFSLGGDDSGIWNDYNSSSITAEANIFSLLGKFNCTGNVTCNDVIANGWAYVGQVHFKQNSSGNYISIGNYNNAWNNYYYAPGYHAFYCNGNGIAYVQSNGIKMNNYDIMFNLGHGIKYGESEWILRGYKSGDYNVTALGNGNRRTVLYGSQVRLNGANGTTVTSDRRLKKDFADFDERYEKFFMSLKPQTYRMAYTKKSEEYKTANGFLAQDVEQSLINANINPDELDIISCDTADKEYLNDMFNGHPPDVQKQYSLNYNNFISLNTYMIQKNRKYLIYQSGMIDMQQAIINNLQSRLWQVEKEIKKLKQVAQ